MSINDMLVGILGISLNMTGFTKKRQDSRLSPSQHKNLSISRNETNTRRVSELSMWDNDRQTRPSEPEKPKFSLVSMLIYASILMVTTFTGYFLVNKFIDKAPTKIPLISAPKGPYKIRPQDPGGIIFPHQDKFVYSKIDPSNQQVKERILPKAERPITLPQKIVSSRIVKVQQAPTPLIENIDKVQIAEAAAPQPHQIQRIQEQPPHPQPAPRHLAQKPAPAYPVYSKKQIAPNRPVIRQQPQAAKAKPNNTARPSFNKDFAKLVSGEQNPNHSSNIVIPDEIPSDSPLLATKPPKRSRAATKPINKVRYRLQLATLPSQQAAEQEKSLLVSTSGLSSAKFEVQGFTNSGGQIVYRILYGNCKSERKAQKMRKLLIKKGLHPIILRME